MRVAILGAGESGVGAALLAKKHGYEVFVSDSGEVKPGFMHELIEADIEWEEGKHDEVKILASDILVKSPGIPDTAEIIVRARKRGISVISEIEWGFRFVKDAKIIAITGSNGKTTTSNLVYKVLADAGLSVCLAGNVGNSFARELLKDQKDYYVLELSSFQLDGIEDFKPYVSVILNITPDHLDRYDYEVEKYAKSKLNITRNQDENDYLIYWKEDEWISKMLENMKVQCLVFSNEKHDKDGAYIGKNDLNIRISDELYSMKTEDINLKGRHNLHNGMAAGIVGKVLNIRNESIRESFAQFTNVPHRLEEVLTIRGVRYINDSKATNVNAVWYALDSIQKPIVWIAGGVDKGNNYAELNEVVDGKVKVLICLGDGAENLQKAFADRIERIEVVKNMEEALEKAYDNSQPGDVVLLSPACASFDLYSNYEERGNDFKEKVRQL